MSDLCTCSSSGLEMAVCPVHMPEVLTLPSAALADTLIDLFFCERHDYNGNEPCPACWVEAREEVEITKEVRPLTQLEEPLLYRIDRARDAFKRYAAPDRPVDPADRWPGERILLQCDQWLEDARSALAEIRVHEWQERINEAGAEEAKLVVAAPKESTPKESQ